MQLRTLAILLCLPTGLVGAEPPYFIAYSQQMEEPGNLEISISNLVGKPGRGNRFLGTAAELEYGLTGWWTTAFYLEGQSTARDSTLLTGFRWENRIRPLAREHWINPVLYLEFENINGANKSLLAVVGNDGQDSLGGLNAETRLEKKRELEAKLILSSNAGAWNISENFIVEKNLRHAPFEFGYAAGVSRPLSAAARPGECSVCPENFRVGVEAYGGLGTHAGFGLSATSHYVAPVLSWEMPSGTTVKVSPGFGVTGQSARFLLRFGVSYEIAQFGRRVREMFR